MKSKVIFFGNGILSEVVLAVLEQECQIIFHAKTKDDLAQAVAEKQQHPEAHGILASFGVLIREGVLAAFEPEGILNIHPSLLPLYRGASPIESAILAGATAFSVSVMKLVKAMDAGPIYYQQTFSGGEIAKSANQGLAMPDLPREKSAIYEKLGQAGAQWLVDHLGNLPEPTPQDDNEATFCDKFTKADGALTPETEPRTTILRKIVAFSGFPKAKCHVCGLPCTILEAHLPVQGETAPLTLDCLDGPLVLDKLQPDGRKAMDAKSFLNGYGRGR